MHTPAASVPLTRNVVHGDAGNGRNRDAGSFVTAPAASKNASVSVRVPLSFSLVEQLDSFSSPERDPLSILDESEGLDVDVWRHVQKAGASSIGK